MRGRSSKTSTVPGPHRGCRRHPSSGGCARRRAGAASSCRHRWGRARPSADPPRPPRVTSSRITVSPRTTLTPAIARTSLMPNPNRVRTRFRRLRTSRYTWWSARRSRRTTPPPGDGPRGPSGRPRVSLTASVRRPRGRRRTGRDRQVCPCRPGPGRWARASRSRRARRPRGCRRSPSRRPAGSQAIASRLTMPRGS